ncbi:hypothetical protein [Nocardioides sp.]|uniref:divisome protein SepX/GlpR n=1 Tax=Nocardioides sp. TaxID=35761 RepID=UPI003528C010
MGIPHVDVLLFVGVAVAWAIYLIPKAIQHHEQATKDRSVDRFSDRLRVLARREPTSSRAAALVVSGKASAPAEDSAEDSAAVSAAAAPATAATVAAQVPPTRPALGASPVEVRAAQARRQRQAAQRATRRRRRVLGLLLLALAAVAGGAATGSLAWGYVGIPGGLLAAWLVACRLMVKGERAARRRPPRAVPAPAETPAVADELDMDETTEIARVAAAEPGMWDPVPVTLPTYVDKPAATRTVRGIDLGAEGVWTSGRTEADAALARRADAEAAAARAACEADDASGGQRAAGAAG